MSIQSDGNFITARQEGRTEIIYPLARLGDYTNYFVIRRYIQNASRYSRTAIGTAHAQNGPGGKTVYLLDESELNPSSLRLGMAQFTRTYAPLFVDTVTWTNTVVTVPSPPADGGAIEQADGITSFWNGWLFWRESATAIAIRAFAEMEEVHRNNESEVVWTDGVDSLSALSYYEFLFSSPHGLSAGDEVIATNDGVVSVPFELTADNIHSSTVIRLHLNPTYTGTTQYNGTVIYDKDAGAVAMEVFGSNEHDCVWWAHLRDFKPGTRRLRARRTTKYYWPGKTPGVTTGADIPVPVENYSTDLELLYQLLTDPEATGWVVLSASELEQFNGPMLRLSILEINIGDLAPE